MNPSGIFTIKNKKEFERRSLEVFRHQAKNNPVYGKYIQQLRIIPEQIKTINQIPFLPIEFFKTQKVETVRRKEEGVERKRKSHFSRLSTPGSRLFLSSGTTGMERSKHFVSDIGLYERSFRKCFELFYGDVKQYAILAFLPSYYENKSSSLLYMVNDLINNASSKSSQLEGTLRQTTDALKKLLLEKKRVILFGVSYALLDLVFGSFPLVKGGRGDLIVIETGGMKGRREEITREELHKTLCEKFGVKKIHSEYGMTELLSQAYSKGDGIFNCPPWMKVFVRDVNDPFQITNYEFGTMNKNPTATGAINIIDLANINSCSFIATQDIGKIHRNNSFEVLGRMDNSDLRGCNLLAG